VIPSTRLLWTVVVLAAFAIAVSIYPDYQLPWAAVAAALLVLALLDAFAGLRLRAPAAARRVPGSLALGVRSEVRLRLANAAGMRLHLELHDHHPARAAAPRRARARRLGRARLPGAAGRTRRDRVWRRRSPALFAPGFMADHPPDR
jgi:hypothetical protein